MEFYYLCDIIMQQLRLPFIPHSAAANYIISFGGRLRLHVQGPLLVAVTPSPLDLDF